MSEAQRLAEAMLSPPLILAGDDATVVAAWYHERAERLVNLLRQQAETREPERGKASAAIAAASPDVGEDARIIAMAHALWLQVADDARSGCGDMPAYSTYADNAEWDEPCALDEQSDELRIWLHDRARTLLAMADHEALDAATAPQRGAAMQTESEGANG